MLNGLMSHYWPRVVRRVARWRRRRHLERVRQFKVRRMRDREPHNDLPKVSFVLLSFNHVVNIGAIAKRLQRLPDTELIVCEDGSIDGSFERWSQVLTGSNNFLVRSNDLHEIRTYERAAGYARGEIICLLQDDDIPPSNSEWLDNAVHLFDQYPKLAILGGYHAFLDLEIEMESGHLVHVYPKQGPAHRTADGLPFQFVEMINGAPILIRREALQEMGGLDLSYSAVGEPGIHYDHEICLRAWSRGFQVGWNPMPFMRFVGGSGTKIFGQMDKRVARAHKNQAKLVATYGAGLPSVQSEVRRLNEGLPQAED